SESLETIPNVSKTTVGVIYPKPRATMATTPRDLFNVPLSFKYWFVVRRVELIVLSSPILEVSEFFRDDYVSLLPFTTYFFYSFSHCFVCRHFELLVFSSPIL